MNMNTRIKKGLKITTISVVSFLCIIFIIIAIVINFIFTPTKLTPLVLKIANENLNARINMSSVDLTFFSSFPDFELRIENGSLISNALNDSITRKQDSLLTFSKCAISIKPLQYIYNNKISIRYILFDKASVYAYISKEGQANWDIISTDTTASAIDTTASSFNSNIDIKRIIFRQANFYFDDRNTDIYTHIDSLNLKMKMSLTPEISELKLSSNCKNLLFWQKGELLINHLAIGLDTDLAADKKTKTFTIDNAKINLNGLQLAANGELKRDTTRQVLIIDMNYGLQAPSVENVLKMIPKSVIKDNKITAEGQVEMSGKIKGEYGDKKLPTVSMKLNIKDASAQYKGMPYGIDKLSADLDIFIDMMRNTPSCANLKIFKFLGAHTDILADGKVENLLDDPYITFHTKSTVDFNALAQTFPLQPGVTLGGILTANLDFKGKLSSVKTQDIGRLYVKGDVDIKNVVIKDINKNFDFTGDASLNFSGDKALSAKATISSVILKSKIANSTIDSLSISAASPEGLPDTTKIIPLNLHVKMQKLRASVGDSIKLYSGRTEADIQSRPSKKNIKKPIFTIKLRTDSLFFKTNDAKMAMDLAGFNITTFQTRDSLWIPQGTIGFNRLYFISKDFGLPIRMKETSVNFERRTISLRQAKIRIGRSNIIATGSVHNLGRFMTKSELLSGKLNISSKRIDCNQLIAAMSSISEISEDDNMNVSDSIANEGGEMHLFVIPKNLDLELTTNVDKVTYNKMIFKNINGIVRLKDQVVNLENLSMEALDAQMKTSMIYKASNPYAAYTGFDFNINKINIGKLVDFIPELDTIVPMLRSFKGLVDFNIAAEARLDSLMNIKIPTLRSAIYIKGDSLVLLDGETFTKLAKILMFKNKKENMFDSISVNITVEDGNVKVYPFLVEIDRYRAAVGGEQNLDMTFNYHVSILKSPLPFKAGVDIYGNLDKVKFKITRAKYKNMVSPAYIQKIDSTRMNMGKVINSHFRRLINLSPRNQ